MRLQRRPEHPRLGAAGRRAAAADARADRQRPGSTEYLDAIRDVERRIQRAEERNAESDLPLIDVPAGMPDTFEDHIQVMFDLQVLAYQADITRVITFLVGRELSNRTYPAIGINEAHHSLSHHQNNAEKLAKLTKINTYHIQKLTWLPREAARDPRRRRLAARSSDARLRQRPERRQPPRSLAAADPGDRRRGRQAPAAARI